MRVIITFLCNASFTLRIEILVIRNIRPAPSKIWDIIIKKVITPLLIISKKLIPIEDIIKAASEFS